MDRAPIPTGTFIERTAAVLLALADERAPMGTTELARRLNMGTTTVHRILRGLLSSGLVAYVPRERVYRLGATAWQLGLAAMEGLPPRSVARPYLYELRDLTGETAVLWIASGRWIAPVEQVITNQEPKRMAALGYGALLHTCIAGKVALESLSAEMAERYLVSVKDQAFDRDRLQADIDVIRAQGFGINIESRGRQVNQIAIPTVQGGGPAPVACITIVGPSERWTNERILACAAECAEIVHQLSERLGRLD